MTAAAASSQPANYLSASVANSIQSDSIPHNSINCLPLRQVSRTQHRRHKPNARGGSLLGGLITGVRRVRRFGARRLPIWMLAFNWVARSVHGVDHLPLAPGCRHPSNSKSLRAASNDRPKSRECGRHHSRTIVQCTHTHKRHAFVQAPVVCASVCCLRLVASANAMQTKLA